jgi:LPS-assembly protein
MPLRLSYRLFIFSLLVTFSLNFQANAKTSVNDDELKDNKNSNRSNHYLLQSIEQDKEKSEKQERREKRKQAKQTAGEETLELNQSPNTSSRFDSPQAQQNVEAIIESDEQRREGDTYIATGYVVITYGVSKLQADKVIFNSVSGDAEAEGNVIYDPDSQQRITAEKTTLNIYTKKGTFYQAQGFTDQTSDGATLNFVAERVEKTGLDSYTLHGASLTACEQAVPAWKFESDRIGLRVNRSATIKGGLFRFKGVPLFYMPYAAIPIGKRERQSGFLIPTTGSSTQKGRFFRSAYYQTLGRSADALFTTDIYSKRGVGFGTVFRARPDELSSIKLGTFTVVDRLFEQENLPGQRNEGGTLFFAKGIQYLPNGFFAGVDVDFTTSLAFRRTFANDAEQVFNPEKRSQLYIINNFHSSGANYTFNMLAEGKSDTLFNTRDQIDFSSDRNVDITVRHLPSFELIGYGQQIANLPLYLSFDTAAEGLYRRERLNETITFITPTIVQRFDMSPKLTLVVPDVAGWAIRPEFRLRSTYYTSSLRPSFTDVTTVQPSFLLNQLSPNNVFRKYAEFTLNIRPPSLAKTYANSDGSPRVKHVIEPTLVYHNISGINNFNRIIRFDERDAVANTNEIEYGITNRFFVPKETNDGRKTTHEVLSIALTQKYFFDPTFGGALKPGLRNQFFPINTLSGFTFGSQERNFSPLNVNVRYRPLSSVSADMRMDYDTSKNKVRNFSVAGSYSKGNFSISERYYKISSLQSAPGVIEPGTFPGSLLVTSIGIGNESKGYYGGGTFTYDFTDRIDSVTGVRARAGLRRSSTYFGYACDCGNIELSLTTINVNGFSETRVSFSFTLSGVGSFGTDQNR